MGDIRVNIAKNIALYRKLNNLSQKSLAEKLNTRQSTVSSWERGDNAPDIETMFDICDIFNISVTDLYGKDTAQNKKEAPTTMQELSSNQLRIIKAYDAADVKDREHFHWMADKILNDVRSSGVAEEVFLSPEDRQSLIEDIANSLPEQQD